MCHLGELQKLPEKVDSVLKGISNLAQYRDSLPKTQESRRLLGAFRLGRRSREGAAVGRACHAKFAKSCQLPRSVLLQTFFEPELGPELEPIERSGSVAERSTSRQMTFAQIAGRILDELDDPDLLHHPWRNPKDAKYRYECQRCEAKRDVCGTVRITIKVAFDTESIFFFA